MNLARNLSLLLITLLALALLTGCSSLEEKSDSELSVELLYQKGKKSLDEEDYEIAIKTFETLEARFPFGIYAQQAQLNVAYAYYKFNEPDSAISTADTFIKTYPRNEHVDYAYYLRGLARFPDETDFFDSLFNLDPARRDPRAATESFQYFAELLQRFPDSIYSADAKQRMIHIRNYLARHEIYVANYYMKRKAYVAAANRAKYIIEDLSRTPAVPDALVIMVKAYKKLGFDDLAADAARVLKLNFPERAAELRTSRREQ